MKIFSLALLGLAASDQLEEIGAKFKSEFEENLKHNVKYYTKSNGKGRNKTYRRLDEANKLPYGLSLKEADFDLAFDFCDDNGDGVINIKKEIPKCTEKAMKIMSAQIGETEELPKIGMRARKKFDFDHDRVLSKSEFATSCAVLNKSFAQTIISIFDGIDGSEPNGALNGMTEVIAMGGMMSKFYENVDQSTSRGLLNSVNVDGNAAADKMTITELEIQDFMQKLMTAALETCFKNDCI